jgi:hypothetical protein
VCCVLTITGICAQYIKYSDNNYLDDSLVRDIFIYHWIMCLTSRTILSPPLEKFKLGVYSLFINFFKKKYRYILIRIVDGDPVVLIYYAVFTFMRAANYTATKSAMAAE